MREFKIHLAVDIKRTVPKYFEATTAWVLCDTPNARRLTKDREMVTCNRCRHFMKEFGEKYVIPRGNAPAATLSPEERFRTYVGAARRAFSRTPFKVL